MAHSAPSPLVCPVFIGREQAIADFDRLAEEAGAGAARLLVVAGEAGIGKSRLANELSSRVAMRGWAVLEGRCFEPDRLLPLAPLFDLLRALVTRPPPTLPQGSAARARALIERLERTMETGGEGPASGVQQEVARQRMYDEVVDFCTAILASGPVLLLLEDIHRSDDTSLDLLLYLMHRLRDHPVLILLTCRTQEAHPALERFLTEAGRRRVVMESELRPLTPGETETMVRALLRLDRPVRAEFLHRLNSVTEGNPFFIEEVIKGLVALYPGNSRVDSRPLVELPIPRTIQETLRRRLAELSPGARQALTHAAVAGRWLDPSLLQALLDCDEQALLQPVRELLTAGLVVEAPGDGLLAFRHELVRRAAYAQLLVLERRSLHRRVMEALVRQHANDLAPLWADLSYHAHRGRAWEQALEYGERAGWQSLASYSPAAAVEHFSWALEGAQQLSLPPASSLVRARGQAYQDMGDFDHARVDYESALQQAQEAGEHRMEWQALLDLGALWLNREYGEAERYLRLSLELARRLGEPACIGQSLNRLGNWCLNRDQEEEGLRHHEEAMKVLEWAGERRDLAATLDHLGFANIIRGELVQAWSYYDRAVSLFRELDDRPMLVNALGIQALLGGHVMANVFLPAAPLPECAALAEEAIRIARGIGWPTGESFAMANLGTIRAEQGEFGQAIDLLRQALHIAEEIEHRAWEQRIHGFLGLVFTDLHAFGHAERHLDTAVEIAERNGLTLFLETTLSWVASLRVLQGRVADAEAVLQRSRGGGTEASAMTSRVLACASAEVALARGDAREALARADELIASTPGRSGNEVVARLGILRGRALLALGDLNGSEATLRQAEQMAAVHHMRVTQLRAEAALGRLYVHARRRREARELAAEAWRRVDELVAGLEDPELAQAFLDHAERTLPRPSARQARDTEIPGGLTARERQVAALIARGLTNQQIADELVISPQTVETHVKRVLGKLSFASRSQVAAWAVERGLVKRTDE